MPSATRGDTTKWFNAVSDEPAKVGVWTHVAAVFDSTDDSLALYVNGRAQGGAGDVASFYEPNWSTWIGRSGVTWFAGDIADVRVWTRAVGDAELFAEAAPKVPMVNWQFEDQSSPTTATDSSGRDADGTFTGGVTWNTTGHPSPADNPDSTDIDRGSITLNGTNAGVSTRARLRTDQSFTASAWVRLTKDTANATAVGQSGQHASGFQSGYSSDRKWRFVMPTTDVAAPPVSITAQDPAPAAINTWTHLAGVYDATAGTMKLYVNGTEVASTTHPGQTWNSTGQLVAGRTWWNDAFRDHWTGDIDDVQVIQVPLSVAGIGELMGMTRC